MPRRSPGMTRLLSFAEESKRVEIRARVDAHGESVFPFHTYIVIGKQDDGTVWCKIGRAKDVQSRLASFGYPDVFQELGITCLVNIGLVSWLTKEDYQAAEIYTHRHLDPFRYRFPEMEKRSEWFTSQHTSYTVEEFLDKVVEVWDKLKQLGALCWREDDGEVYANTLTPRCTLDHLG